MSDTIFDLYLKNGLLPNLDGNDDIYNKLTEAAKSLAETLKKEKSKLPSFALVAFDPHITETEPLLKEVEKAVTPKWQMVQSKFTEMPVALYRAILLQALEALVQKSPKEEYATVIYWSIVDIYPYLDYTPKEGDILKALLEKFGEIAEKNAENEWSINKPDLKISLPKLTIQLVKGNIIQLDENSLKERLINASGPYASGENKARPGANPYWSNQASQWSLQFAPLAAKGITEVVNKALSQINKPIEEAIAEIEKELTKYFSGLSESLKKSLQEAIQSAVALEQRSQLLWWKEALYSKTLRKSYRKLTKFQAAIAMAMDLDNMLPRTFPTSIDYLLRETYGRVFGFQSEAFSIGIFINEINDSANRAFLENFFKTSNLSTEGRIDLSSFIKKVIYSKVDIEKELVPCIGVNPDTKITYEDLSVWILHTMSTNHLIEK